MGAIKFNLLIRFSCFLLIFARTCEAFEENENFHEKTFYAISSLYFHLNEITNSNAQSIVFNEEDIANLWEIASLDPHYLLQIEQARQNYYCDLHDQTKNLLKAIWHELDSCLIGQHTDDQQNHHLHVPFILSSIPNFDDNPLLTSSIKKKIKPFLIPSNHPAKSALDTIFYSSRAIENENTLQDAGFITLFNQPYSFIRVAKHPTVPGYLFKIYLDSELRQKENKQGWEWLVHRCEGAENVRNLIKTKKMKRFSVPDKWIYPLPICKLVLQPIILLVTDMKLTSHEESIDAWKNKITREHLKELYCILSHGFASSHLIWNIPYSKSGKFACIDTEHPKRLPEYREVKQYLSTDMCAFWDKLVKTGGNAR